MQEKLENIVFWTIFIVQPPPKSLYRSRARHHFYGLEDEIWAGFGQVGNAYCKKNWAAKYATFDAVF